MTVDNYSKTIKPTSNSLEKSIFRLIISLKTFLGRFSPIHFIIFHSFSMEDPFYKVLFIGKISNSLITNFAYEK